MPKTLPLVKKNAEPLYHCGRRVEMAENGLIYCPHCGKAVAATPGFVHALKSVEDPRLSPKVNDLLNRIEGLTP